MNILPYDLRDSLIKRCDHAATALNNSNNTTKCLGGVLSSNYALGGKFRILLEANPNVICIKVCSRCGDDPTPKMGTINKMES